MKYGYARVSTDDQNPAATDGCFEESEVRPYLSGQNSSADKVMVPCWLSWR